MKSSAPMVNPPKAECWGRNLPAYYNEIDPLVADWLREPVQAEKLRHLLYYTPHARSEYDLSFESVDCPIEAARRTIVRSFMGYGSNAVTGQYKSGFRGKRAGSAGPALEWSRYEGVIPEFVARLRTVTMECAPALEIIDRYDAIGTLFYVDPPYVWDTRTTHGASYRHEMTEEDHMELAGMLHSLSGMVILSGYGCELYDRLYADWLVIQKETRANSNAKRLEQLWISPNAQAALPQQLLMEGV